MTIRLLLADDQALVRGALSALLGLEPDLEVVPEVASGPEVVPAVLEHRPDVALLDVEMPGLDGISAAAEIAADLPNTTDDVPSDRRELFAWTVREGITNVIRHSGATRCTVVLGRHEVEVRDDGRGAASASCDESGNGLIGLRERAAALGGTVVTRSLQPGFSLKVVVP